MPRQSTANTITHAEFLAQHKVALFGCQALHAEGRIRSGRGGLRSAPCESGEMHSHQVKQLSCTAGAAAGPGGRALHPVRPFFRGTPQNNGQQSLHPPHPRLDVQHGADHCLQGCVRDALAAQQEGIVCAQYCMFGYACRLQNVCGLLNS